MIEVTIREGMELLCLLTIRPARDKQGELNAEALDVNAFIPGDGITLSATIPAGGERPAQVARALMAVFPPVLTPKEFRQWKELERKNAELDEKEARLDKKERDGE